MFAAFRIMVMAAAASLVWLSCACASATCFDGFIDGLLQVIPREKIGLIHADSGFLGYRNLEYLEYRELNYIIASLMHVGLKQKIFEWRN